LAKGGLCHGSTEVRLGWVGYGYGYGYSEQVVGKHLKWKKEQWPQVWYHKGVISLHFIQSVGDTSVLEGAKQLRSVVKGLLKEGCPEKETWHVAIDHDSGQEATKTLGEW